jgi:hypothetical protein
VLHDAAGEGPLKANELPPDTLAANDESFFVTLGLPHSGQVTSSIAFELRRSSSKGWLQALQTNSNNGI